MNGIFLLMKRTLLGKGNKKIFRNMILQSMLFFGVKILKWPISISLQVWCTILFAIGFSSTLYVLLSDTYRINIVNQFMLPFRRATFNSSLLVSMTIYVFNTKLGYVFFLAASSSLFSFFDGILMLTTILVTVIISIVFFTAIINKSYWISMLLTFITSCLMLVIYSGISNTTQTILFVLILGSIFVYFHKMEIASCLISIAHKSTKVSIRKKNGWINIPRYCIRYIAGNIYFIINMLGILAFGMFFSYTFYQGNNDNLKSGLSFGMALISLNSPLSSVVSGDKSLARKIDLLPQQLMSFFLPYGIVVLFSGLITNSLFLLFWYVITSVFDMWALHMAINFALQSAVIAMLLEHDYPYLSWNVESDLWRHPRKYITVIINLLYASVLIFLPLFNFVISVLLVLQFVMLLVVGIYRQKLKYNN